MQDSLQVPVGVINCSCGSTTIESWLGKKTIGKYDFIKPVKDKKGPKPSTPSAAYNAMLHPIIGIPI